MTAATKPGLRVAMRERREDLGLTQTEIASRVNRRGVKQGVLSQIEKGHKDLRDFDTPIRLRVLQEYGFNDDEIRELNKLHALELEFVLPSTEAVITDHETVRIGVVGRLGREFATVPRRILRERRADSVVVFDPPPATLVDTRVARALRAGTEFLLDTTAAPAPGEILVYHLRHGGYAAFVDRGDERPIATESLDGKNVNVLTHEDLGELIGVVWHAQLSAEGLLGLIGPS